MKMLTNILLSCLFGLLASMIAVAQHFFYVDTGSAFIAAFIFISIGYAVAASLEIN